MSWSWVNPLNAKLTSKTSLVFIVILFLGVFLKNMFFSTTPVGVVDVNRIKAHFIRNLAEHKLSNAKMRAATALFNQSLTVSLKEYAESYDIVLIKKDAVLASGSKPSDVTDDVMKTVATNMRRLAHA